MFFILKRCGRHMAATLLTIILVLAGLPNVAQAQSGNYISDVWLVQPRCNGIIKFGYTFTLDSSKNRFITEAVQGQVYRGGAAGSAGTHTRTSSHGIFAFPSNTLVTIEIRLGTNWSLGNLDTASITFNCTTGEIIHPSSDTSSTSSSSRTSAGGPPCMALLDGRINSVLDKDCAAPIAIYGSPLQIYVIDPASGDGHLAFSLSDAEIEAVGVPAENILLAEAVNPFTGLPVRLYRLNTGEFQLNTWAEDGSAYVLVWDDAGSKYRLPG